MEHTSQSSPMDHLNGNKNPKKRKATEKKHEIDLSVDFSKVLNLTPGKLLLMGQGDAGQLGFGPEKTEIFKPKKIDVLKENLSKKIIHVACGGLHTVALTTDGMVFTWGCNDESALGRCTDVEDSEYSPGLVEFPPNCFVIKVTAGDSHSSALTNRGEVYGWGVFRDDRGIIGMTKSRVISKTPELLYSNPDDICEDVCSGNDHMLLLTKSGKVLSCGSPAEGQLGRVSERFGVYRGLRSGLEYLLHPREVNVLPVSKNRRSISSSSFGNINGIYCGKCSSFATTDKGLVYGWGLNNYSQVSDVAVNKIFYPQRLRLLQSIVTEGSVQPEIKITGGIHHTLVLNVETGALYSFGSSLFGRLGQGKPEDGSTCSKLPALVSVKEEAVKFKFICCGESSSFAISNDGKLYSWGFGSNRHLGSDNEDDVWTPLRIRCTSLDETTEILYVSSGAQHTAVIQ